MSAAPASGGAPAAKAVTADKSAEPPKDAKPAAALEEDDEFEDFPVESMSPSCSACWDTNSWQAEISFGMQLLTMWMADWTQEDTEVPGDNTHLWEESWDDDDTSEDFSAQLKWATFEITG